VTRWAPLDGWVPDPNRPGYFRHPDSDPSWLRTPDGRWWDTADIDAQLEGLAIQIDEATDWTAVQEAEQKRALLAKRIRRAAEELGMSRA
jgi:hypothetical protein